MGKLLGAIELMRRVAADAAHAEELHADPTFRAALRGGTDVFRTFTVTALPSADGSARREIKRSWRLRLDPDIPRPLL